MTPILGETLRKTNSTYDDDVGMVTKLVAGKFDDGTSLFFRAKQDTKRSIGFCLADLTENDRESSSVSLWSGFGSILAIVRKEENLLKVALDFPNIGRIIYSGRKDDVDLAAVVLTACGCLPDRYNNSSIGDYFSYGGGRIVLSAIKPETVNSSFDAVLIRLRGDEDTDNLLTIGGSEVKGMVDASLKIIRDQENSPVFLVIDQNGGLSDLIETYCTDLRNINALKKALRSI